jgi:hypothetical protein
MAIYFYGPNEDFSSEITEAILRLGLAESPSLSGSLGLSPGSVEVWSPVPVIVLGLEAVIEDGFVFPDGPDYWRYLISQNGKPVSFADLPVHGADKFERLIFVFGPRALGLISALGFLNKALSVGTFAGIVLEIPEIDLRFLIVDADEGVLAPIRPDFAGIGAMRLWTLSEVHAITLAAKNRIAKEDDTPQCSGC